MLCWCFCEGNEKFYSSLSLSSIFSTKLTFHLYIICWWTAANSNCSRSLFLPAKVVPICTHRFWWERGRAMFGGLGRLWCYSFPFFLPASHFCSSHSDDDGKLAGGCVNDFASNLTIWQRSCDFLPQRGTKAKESPLPSDELFFMCASFRKSVTVLFRWAVTHFRFSLHSTPIQLLPRLLVAGRARERERYSKLINADKHLLATNDCLGLASTLPRHPLFTNRPTGKVREKKMTNWKTNWLLTLTATCCWNGSRSLQSAASVCFVSSALVFVCLPFNFFLHHSPT